MEPIPLRKITTDHAFQTIGLYRVDDGYSLLFHWTYQFGANHILTWQGKFQGFCIQNVTFNNSSAVKFLTSSGVPARLDATYGSQG